MHQGGANSETGGRRQAGSEEQRHHTEDLEAVVGGRTVFVVGYRLIRWTNEDRHQRVAEKRVRRNYKQQAAPFSSASAVFGCSGAIIPE